MSKYDFLNAYESLKDKLYAFAISLTKNNFDAEDLVQETAMRAYAKRDLFRVGTNFKAWILTIMRNIFLTNYRVKRYRNLVNEPIEDHTEAIRKNTTMNECEQKLMLEELRDLIMRVKYDFRIPFLMHYKGYTYEEIAAHLEIPIGTVKSRIYAARQCLSKLIKVTYREDKLMRA